jgi:hypothetical protein
MASLPISAAPARDCVFDFASAATDTTAMGVAINSDPQIAIAFEVLRDFIQPPLCS